MDAFAIVIKSAAKTRRATKMVILNAGHPDVEACASIYFRNANYRAGAVPFAVYVVSLYSQFPFMYDHSRTNIRLPFTGKVVTLADWFITISWL